jgi:hypothetical protein
MEADLSVAFDLRLLDVSGPARVSGAAANGNERSKERGK